MSDFKVGEKVDYFGHKGTILRTNVPVKDDNNKPGAIVEWDNRNLCPSQMTVPYNTLNLEEYDTPRLPTGKNSSNLTEIEMADTTKICPICRTEWKETEIVGKLYYDCLPCNRKREDIMEEYRLKVKAPCILSGDRR